MIRKIIINMLLATAVRARTTTKGRYHNYTTEYYWRHSMTPWEFRWARSWSATYNPVEPTLMWREYWAIHYQSRIIANMTAELIKDCQMKQRQQDIIQEAYKHTKSFKLGYISAGVLERFDQLVSIYEHYSRYELWSYRSNETLSYILNGYQIMQQYYNEMRIDKQLFFDIISDANEKRRLQQEKMKKRGKRIGIPLGMSLYAWQNLNKEEQANLIEEQKKRVDEYHRKKQGNRRSGGDTDYFYDSVEDEAKNISYRSAAPEVTNQHAQEEYKKSLRYVKWVEKWKGFNAGREGIDISNNLAQTGNKSSLLALNLF